MEPAVAATVEGERMVGVRDRVEGEDAPERQGVVAGGVLAVEGAVDPGEAAIDER